MKRQNVPSSCFYTNGWLIRDPMNGKTEIYQLSCSVRIFKYFKWDTFKIIFDMKNGTLFELFNCYGSVHILRNHREGEEGSLKCLRMIMREGEGVGLMMAKAKIFFFTK